MDCSPVRLLCPWESPGENTGVGCHVLLQGILPSRDGTCLLRLLHWQAGSLSLGPPGKPILYLDLCFIFRASLVAQLVKNLPAMQETWVRSLAWEDPLEKEKALQYSGLENSMNCIVHGDAKSWT